VSAWIYSFLWQLKPTHWLNSFDKQAVVCGASPHKDGDNPVALPAKALILETIAKKYALVGAKQI